MQESTRLQLEGDWQQWKGRLRGVWGELTNDDLDRVQGDTDRLIGLIKKRTGESLEAIHERLDQMARDK